MKKICTITAVILMIFSFGFCAFTFSGGVSEPVSAAVLKQGDSGTDVKTMQRN